MFVYLICGVIYVCLLSLYLFAAAAAAVAALSPTLDMLIQYAHQICYVRASASVARLLLNFLLLIFICLERRRALQLSLVMMKM